jgi:hypothetical protein
MSKTPQEEAQETLNKKIAHYKKQDWPWQLLERDFDNAQAFHDNGFWSSMKAFEHEWKWDKDDLYLPVKEIGDKKPTLKPWKHVGPKINRVKAMTWEIISNFVYTEEGLVERSSWEWKSLEPVYTLPYKIDYSYVDIVSSCWEFEGLMGFGFGIGNHHGHANIEFCDGSTGKVYTVGQYPNPVYEKFGQIFKTIHGILLSPDPYSTIAGEKVVHRYYLGPANGVGKDNIAKLISRIESFQKTGVIHNPSSQNCTDFAIDFDVFVQTLPEVKLVDMEKEKALLPFRRLVTKHVLTVGEFIQIYIVGFLINLLMTIMFLTPWLGATLGRGSGASVDKLDQPNGEIAQLDYSLRWSGTTWTRNLRVKQLWDAEISKKSARFIID